MKLRRTSWTAYAIAAGSVFAMSAATAWAQDVDTHSKPASANASDRADSALLHRNGNADSAGLSNDWIRSAEDRDQDPTKFPPRVNHSESAPDTTGLERARTQADEHAEAGLERAETNAADHESSSTAHPTSKDKRPDRS